MKNKISRGENETKFERKRKMSYENTWGRHSLNEMNHNKNHCDNKMVDRI